MAAKMAKGGEVHRPSIEFKVKLPFKLTKRAKWFLSSCPVLDVHSQGDTEQSAKDHLIEAVSLFLSSCFERGVLDDVLKECGFIAVHGSRRLPTPLKGRDKENFINVPIPFTIDPRAECRA